MSFVQYPRLAPYLIGLIGRQFLFSLLLVTLALALPAPAARAQNQSQITSPAPGSAVSGSVPIIGTAVIEPFRNYELYYKLEPSGNDAYAYFGGDTRQVASGQLGVWQAADLPPGVYTLRLRIVKQDGNYDEVFSPNLSVNQAPASPTATATSSVPTETPIPTATFTPATQPTAQVGQVTQPLVDQLPPTPTPEAVAVANAGNANTAVDTNASPANNPNSDNPAAGTNNSSGNGNATGNGNVASPAVGNTARALGEALSLEKLRGDFARGIRLSAAIFIGALAIFFGKRVIEWVWTRFR